MSQLVVANASSTVSKPTANGNTITATATANATASVTITGASAAQLDANNNAQTLANTVATEIVDHDVALVATSLSEAIKHFTSSTNTNSIVAGALTVNNGNNGRLNLNGGKIFFNNTCSLYVDSNNNLIFNNGTNVYRLNV